MKSPLTLARCALARAVPAMIFIFFAQDSFAAKADTTVDKTKAPVVYEISIDFAEAKLRLTGFNFMPDGEYPTIYLGDDGTALSIVSASDTFLTVAFDPSITPDGDYMLLIENSEKEQIGHDLTINRKLSESSVIAYVESNGFVPGAHYTDAQAIAAVGPHMTNSEVETIVAAIVAPVTIAVSELQQAASAQQSEIVTLQNNLSTAYLTIAGLQNDLASAQSLIAELQVDVVDLNDSPVSDLAPFITVSYDPIAGLTGPHILFNGANIHVRSGVGATVDTTSGLGNLIIGYNEDTDIDFPRTGAHNLVVGSRNGFSSYGGLIAGEINWISAPYATITGGQWNEASGTHAAVTGGNDNIASGYSATVNGGFVNHATAFASSVSGGRSNVASGRQASIAGGYNNRASGNDSMVAGGDTNTASGEFASVTGGHNNRAVALNASVSGGRNNIADVAGWYATIAGGDSNQTGGIAAFIGGGFDNRGWGDLSSVAGGASNVAGHNYTSISGGANNFANAEYSWIGGGEQNETAGQSSSISGGQKNHAVGWVSSVSGGSQNWANGNASSVTGGDANTANAFWSVVSGGRSRFANDVDEWVAANVVPRLHNLEDGLATLGTDLDVHAMDVAAHHARYDDNEAIAAVGPHYTDADALLAVQGEIDVFDSRIASTESQLVTLEARPIFDLEPFVTVTYGDLNAVAGPHVLFEGANVHVRSGSGSTDDGGTGDYLGLGNLIIGYNEYCCGDRTGSHNVVIGTAHQYTSYAGLVAGHRNQLHAESGSICGGYENTVEGRYTSVLGGHFNTATVLATTISGGLGNLSSNHFSSICGGFENETLGPTSSIGGGAFRVVYGDRDWAAGSLFEDE